MRKYLRSKHSIADGCYKLTASVQNPKADKRYHNNFLYMPVWQKDTIIIVNSYIVDTEEFDCCISQMRCLRCQRSQIASCNSDQYKALADSGCLKPTELTLDILLYSWPYVTEYLIEKLIEYEVLTLAELNKIITKALAE